MTQTQGSTPSWEQWLTMDRRVPLWLRIVVLTYANAGEDEVLWMEPGVLSQRLRVTDRKHLRQAIDRAIDLGFLVQPSGSTALRMAPGGGG